MLGLSVFGAFSFGLLLRFPYFYLFSPSALLLRGSATLAFGLLLPFACSCLFPPSGVLAFSSLLRLASLFRVCLAGRLICSCLGYNGWPFMRDMKLLPSLFVFFLLSFLLFVFLASLSLFTFAVLNQTLLLWVFLLLCWL